jgi:hypothetical protein
VEWRVPALRSVQHRVKTAFIRGASTPPNGGGCSRALALCERPELPPEVFEFLCHLSQNVLPFEKDSWNSKLPINEGIGGFEEGMGKVMPACDEIVERLR